MTLGIVPYQRFEIFRHIILQRLQGSDPFLGPGQQHIHHLGIDGLRQGGAVPLVFVSHLHYALLGLRTEEDIAFLPHHLRQCTAQGMFRQHGSNFPNQRRQDVVAPVTH